MRQFVDVGCGIPTMGNVHEVAQNLATDARVLYVDIDPVAIHHARQLLVGNDLAHAVLGDLREPGKIVGQLSEPELASIIDPAQPTALLLYAVLHFVPDDAVAYAAVRTLCDHLAPGSYVVISHAAAEGFDPEQVESAGQVYQRSAQPAGVRTREQIERFFDGLDLVEPGLAWLPQWRPRADDPQDFVREPTLAGLLAGVGALRTRS